MGKRRNNRVSSSRAIYTDPSEEKRVLQYLSNTLNSGMLNLKPYELFKFAAEVFGNEAMFFMLKGELPDKMADEDLTQHNLEHHIDKIVSESEMAKITRALIAPMISEKLRNLPSYRYSNFEARLNILKKTFNLTTEGTEVVAFIYLCRNNEMLESYFINHNAVFTCSTFKVFRAFGHIPLGMKRGSFLKIITDGTLYKAGMIDRGNNSYELEDWCSSYLSGFGGKSLSSEYFSNENDSLLRISDFELSEDNSKVIDTLLKGRKGFNLLLYGKPGTGKTSLTKALAKEYGKQLLTVKVPESGEMKHRLRAVIATLNFADKNSIVLIDEADELLNTHEIFYFGQSVEKSFINNLLETHNKKIIWITNRYENIHASTMRRFAFSLEFKDFSSKNRLKVLKSELKRNKFEDYFTEEELKELCDRYAVNAGSIINAMNLLKIRKKTEKAAVMKQLHTVLKNQEKALSMKKGRSNKKDFKGYSLEGLNCSLKPDELIASLKKYLQIKEGNQPKSERPFSMLLYGMPGTGKSEFIYYLGSLLEKEVLLKRASEITSKWVGETEKNLANAFEEGQEKEGILFFDEADSFLFPRKQAQRSWEISATNEILTQLEAYKGIVAFATNDIQGLDHASLRRFRYKVEFRPLTPEGNLHFYNTVLSSLITGQKALTEDEIKRIQGMNNLTPGDFAVVKDQFMYTEPSGITHQGLIESLINEVKHKQEGRKIAGFGRP